MILQPFSNRQALPGWRSFVPEVSLLRSPFDFGRTLDSRRTYRNHVDEGEAWEMFIPELPVWWAYPDEQEDRVVFREEYVHRHATGPLSEKRGPVVSVRNVDDPSVWFPNAKVFPATYGLGLHRWYVIKQIQNPGVGERPTRTLSIVMAMTSSAPPGGHHDRRLSYPSGTGTWLKRSCVWTLDCAGHPEPGEHFIRFESKPDVPPHLPRESLMDMAERSDNQYLGSYIEVQNLRDRVRGHFLKPLHLWELCWVVDTHSGTAPKRPYPVIIVGELALTGLQRGQTPADDTKGSVIVLRLVPSKDGDGGDGRQHFIRLPRLPTHNGMELWPDAGASIACVLFRFIPCKYIVKWDTSKKWRASNGDRNRSGLRLSDLDDGEETILNLKIQLEALFP